MGKQWAVLDMAADRGAYTDQSQSLNIHMVDANIAKLSSMHFHRWQMGLKAGLYHLRAKAAADAIKFIVDVLKLQHSGECSNQGSKQSTAGVDVARAMDRLKVAAARPVLQPVWSSWHCSNKKLASPRLHASVMPHE